MKVRVEVVPWLTEAFGTKQAGRLVLEEAMADGADIHQLIQGLVAHHPNLGRLAFDPETGNFTGQVSVILNDCFLESPREWDTRLKDGDTIVLLPAFVGG